MSARAGRPWSPEVDLALACARRDLSGAAAARARDAARHVNWDRALAIARAHYLLPLMHLHVSRGALPVPPDVATALATVAASNAKRSLMLAAELRRLLVLFGREHLPVLPLKGPMLADLAFGSISLRRMGDLDILVAPADMPRASALLQREGYRRQAMVAADDEPLADRIAHHVAFVPQAGRFRLELHSRLVPPPGGRACGLDTLAPRLRPAAFMGVETRAFAPEDLFVYLCEHGAKHAWSRLEWLATLGELSRAGAARDEKHVAEMSALVGGGARVAAARALIAELIEDDGQEMRRLPRRLAAANAGVVARLSSEPERALSTYGERMRYQMGTDPGALTRVRRVFMLAFVPQLADARAIPLPRPFRPLYYLIRPLRLAARAVAGRS